MPPFVIYLLLALVYLNLPSKFSADAEYVHYPPPLQKRHKQSEQSVPQPPVSEPIVPYFPFVYSPIPSPSERPYEPPSSPPLKQSQPPLSPFSEPLVPYFPFVYIPTPSPAQKPYEDASPSPSPVFTRPVVPYYPF